MKAILFVALFVLASQAFEFNFAAYHQGFVDQINFNGSQLADTTNCGVSVMKTIADIQKVKEAIQTEGIPQILYALWNLAAEIQANTKDECTAYVTDLAQYFTQKNSTSEIKEEIKKNFETYALYVIQQVAIWSQQSLNHLDYEAGKTEAYIVQILLGLETPDVLPIPTVNNTVPFEADRFYNEYYTGLLTTLGFTNQVDINTVARCGEYFSNATVNVATFEKEFKNLTNFHDKLTLVTKTVKSVMIAADACTAAWEIEKPYYVQAWENFKFLPLLNSIQLIYNVAVNLPEIQQQQVQTVVDVLEGLYEEAGVTQGNVQLTIFKNVTYY